MIVTPAEMRRIEDAVLGGGGTTAGALVDFVGRKIAVRLWQMVGKGRAAVVFYVGKGNNASDALVAAKVLRGLADEAGVRLKIGLRLAYDDPALMGELPRRKFASLLAGEVEILPSPLTEEFASPDGLLVLVDGLLGIGAAGDLRDPIRGCVREINTLRQARETAVIAIDVPTGLNTDTGEAGPETVVADETLAIGFAKTGLVADAAADYVGRLTTVTVPDFSSGPRQVPGGAARGSVVTAEVVGALLPPRPHESNKGMYGRIGLLAGSVGATGAAVMCAHACARGGGGLVTLLTHPDIYPVVAGAASPEVMVKPLPSVLDVLDMDFDVLGLGPGLGREHSADIRELVARWPKPMVVDADGLNAVAEDMSTLDRLAGPRLLTPHPGEMKRLLRGCPELRSLAEHEYPPRASIAREFTDRFPVALLLKGTRTLMAERGLPLAYNSTGNAGMATGGMGDVLTGICCALAGQNLSLYLAACAGAWLHGRAADLAREEGESEQSLLPLDLLSRLGRAFSLARRSTL